MTSPIAGEREALDRIAGALRSAGANLPAPENKGTIESALLTGLSIALAIVEAERDDALLEPVGEGWVSVEERLPAPGKPVLAFYKNSHGLGRTTRAHHSPKHTVDASTWEDGSDDTECGSYEPEGWWEDPTEAEDLAFICHDVTHWMPLPQPPKEKP